MKIFKIFVFILLSQSLALAQSESKDIVGEVLGEPVFRSQITAKTEFKQHQELHSIFTRPVWEIYIKKYEKELQPTQQEIDSFVEFYQKKHEEEVKDQKEQMIQDIEIIKDKLNAESLSKEEKEELEFELFKKETDLQGPGKNFAMFVLPHWKIQMHFYKNYGGGKLLWQQRGIEAFDAMYKWLQEQEKTGKIKFFDEKIRDTYYHYWTTMDHGPFFIEKQERINNEFLNPEWQTTK